RLGALPPRSQRRSPGAIAARVLAGQGPGDSGAPGRTVVGDGPARGSKTLFRGKPQTRSREPGTRTRAGEDRRRSGHMNRRLRAAAAALLSLALAACAGLGPRQPLPPEAQAAAMHAQVVREEALAARRDWSLAGRVAL